MLSLLQAVNRKTSDDWTVNMPYPSLAAMGFAFRRGQLGMMVAAPGGQKSVLAQDIAMRSGTPTLYCSADTDESTMAIRAAAKITGYPQAIVEQYLAGKGGNPEQHAGQFYGALESVPHVRYSFDVTTVNDVGDEVFAYATLMGDWPQLVVIDNLVNIVTHGDDYAAMREALGMLHNLARSTGAHVLVLHHANGQYDNGDRPIPLSGIEQKLSKLPAQVVTLHRPYEGLLRVSVVKNRGGKADAAGTYYAELHSNLDCMRLTDPLTGQEALV